MTRRLELRRADQEDTMMLYHWRNDSDTMKWSAVDKPVDIEDHKRWIERVLVDEDRELYIAVYDSVPVGTIRFDTVKTEDGDKIFISITIAPESRGRGFGHLTLETGCLMKRDYNLNAIINPKNTKSIKIFTACGFAENGKCSTPGFLIFSRGPLLL